MQELKFICEGNKKGHNNVIAYIIIACKFLLNYSVNQTMTLAKLSVIYLFTSFLSSLFF